MSVNIKYKNNSIATMSDTGTKTLKTSGKYCEDDIIVENTKDGITPSGNKAITATTSTQTGIDVTNYATVSVAPTPSEAKSVTTNGDVTPSSGKLLSKVTVNVPTGTARDSSDLTVSGATVNVPAGLYSSAASKSVAIGTAGTPTASKGAVSNNSVTVTPSVANTTGYITGGTKTGAGVKVSASELVSGNKAITPSETAQSGIDVTNFKTASVGAIPKTYVGSGVTRKAAATVAPSTSEQTVCASGVYTTGAQKVSAITPSIVGNLDASSFAASIVAAVEGKGVTVPDGTLLDGMASLIESIEAGGGSGGGDGILMAGGSITPAENTNEIAISHGLGVIPNFLLIFNSEMQGVRIKGQISVMVVTPKSRFGTANESSFAATTQTQAYYQAHSYYRVNLQKITNGEPSSAFGTASYTADENEIHFYGTNNHNYSDYSEFTATKHFWLAVYNPNITYWSDFA